MSSSAPWYDHVWVQSLASMILAFVSVFSVIVIALQLRALNRKNEFDIERHFRSRFDRRYSGDIQHKLFALGMQLASQTALRTHAATVSNNPLARYEENLVRRWVVVSHLPDIEYQSTLSDVVRPLVNHYNEIARLIEFGIVHSAKFLSTYHLAVIRDLYALEPFILHQSRRKEHARWGMRALALAEIAREYHLTNQLHGRPVFLWSRTADRVAYAPILCGWRNGRRPFYYMLRSAFRFYGELSEARKNRQEQLLSRLEKRFARERVQSKVGNPQSLS